MTHTGPAEPIRPLGLIEPNPVAEAAHEAEPEAEAGA